MPRLAVQLYSLRGLDRPLPEVVELIADLGYEGVEFAHAVTGETPPDEIRSAIERFGVDPVAAHVDWRDLVHRLDEVTDYYDAVGCDALVVPHVARSHFSTGRRVRRLARQLERVGARLDDRGYSFHYHNSAHDFCEVDDSTIGTAIRPINPAAVDGTGPIAKLCRGVGILGDFAGRTLGLEREVDRLEETAYYRLVDLTDPDLVGFEVDVGGVTVAGFDPVDVVEHLGSRVSMVHMHDVRIDEPSPWAEKHSVDPGEGSVPFQPIADAAAKRDVEWLIFEHDDPSDPIGTLERGALALGCC